MAIIEYKEGVELKPGQWVNLETKLNHGFAERPALITAVKPASVVVELFRQRLNGDFETDGEVVKRNSNVAWVCDTREEAIHMYLKSREFTRQANELERALTLSICVLRESLVSAALTRATHQEPT